MVLGIDVSKASFDVVLLADEQSKGLHKVFSNSPRGFKELKAWLARQGVEQLHACLESTGSYGVALAEFLVAEEHTVSVVNPRRIKHYAKSRLSRNKTDKQDAFIIARFCLKEQPEPWVPLAPELKQLQALVRRLEDLKDLRLQEENRLEATLNGTVKDSVESMIAYLDEQITAVEAAIHNHIDQHPSLKRDVELLETIPGIGRITAQKLLAEISFANFSSARELASFVGLTPKQNQSGTSLRGGGRLSKIGSSTLRKALYFPAVNARRFNPVIKSFCQNLLDKGKPMMVVVCAAMRKLLHLAFGVLKSGRPFDPEYSSHLLSVGA
jgi:transposase